MSINLIAILLSLAMMLTGAGEAGQPAQMSRTLVLHNATVTINDQTVALAPSARIGATTDGEKAAFDFGLELNGEALLPFQLGVSEAGVTALAVNSGDAVTVTAEAIEAALSGGALSVEDAMASMQAENPELMAVVAEELLPGYLQLLEAVQDKDFQDRLQAQGDALFAEMIDRGEGTPVTENVNGEDMALVRYAYTVNGDQLGALADALFAQTPELSGYYNAIFKLYALMPEESGMNGVASYADAFAAAGVNMIMEIVEELSEDGTVDLTDATLTMDMSGIVAAQQAQQGEDAPEALAELPPLVMNILSNEIGDSKSATVTYDYAVDEGSMRFSMYVGQMPGFESADMSMAFSMEGDEVVAVDASGTTVTDAQTGEISYTCSFEVKAPEGVAFDFAANGAQTADGDSKNSVFLSGDVAGNSYALSFDADVVGDAIEDLANGHEAIVIDDLSEEGLSALGQNQSLMAAVMKAAGSMTEDAGKLMADESVQNAIALLNSGAAQPADVDEYDYAYEIEPEDGDEGDEGEYEIEVVDDGEGDFDYGYEEPEDDGVLGFEVPTLGWLPEDWKVIETNVDTAYDWVDMTLGDDSGANGAYVLFFKDDDSQVNYIVADDGDIAPVEGREVTVSDFGGGSISVTLRSAGLYANMMFESETIDMETIGKIVAGIQF